jgi:hypothetical protein
MDSRGLGSSSKRSTGMLVRQLTKSSVLPLLTRLSVASVKAVNVDLAIESGVHLDASQSCAETLSTMRNRCNASGSSTPELTEGALYVSEENEARKVRLALDEA